MNTAHFEHSCNLLILLTIILELDEEYMLLKKLSLETIQDRISMYFENIRINAK